MDWMGNTVNNTGAQITQGGRILENQTSILLKVTINYRI
jgi:hypothetical protein